jgi:hypothetical protein
VKLDVVTHVAPPPYDILGWALCHHIKLLVEKIAKNVEDCLLSPDSGEQTQISVLDLIKSSSQNYFFEAWKLVEKSCVMVTFKHLLDFCRIDLPADVDGAYAFLHGKCVNDDMEKTPLEFAEMMDSLTSATDNAAASVLPTDNTAASGCLVSCIPKCLTTDSDEYKCVAPEMSDKLVMDC